MSAAGITLLAAALTACAEPTVRPDEPSDAQIASESDAPPAADAGTGAAGPDACARCHPRQTGAWRGSLHAASATDPIYRAEHAERRDPWCTRCHAADGDAVGCASCHAIECGSGAPTGRAPHPLDAALSSPEACGPCHDFDFPGRHDLAMQNTLDEYRSSAAAARGEACTDCHDPHSVPAWRDPAMASRALEVDARAERDGDGVRLVLALRSRAGHAVPTGDLFRRLVVEARSGASARQVLLGRRFGLEGGRRQELADDRVPARGVRRVTFRLPRSGRIDWSIALEALPAGRAAGLLLPERTWRSVLASGSVRLDRAPPRDAQEGLPAR